MNFICLLFDFCRKYCCDQNLIDWAKIKEEEEIMKKKRRTQPRRETQLQPPSLPDHYFPFLRNHKLETEGKIGIRGENGDMGIIREV